MTDTLTHPDNEFAAMQIVYNALEPLDDEARNRVVAYIISRLEIAAWIAPPPNSAKLQHEDPEEAAEDEETETPAAFGSLAELYDAAQPKTNSDKALVAGYWLQVCKSSNNFDGFSANKELKHLGQGVANITNAIENLKTTKPALALQLRKSGKSQQARKTYKLTTAGIKRVEVMINE